MRDKPAQRLIKQFFDSIKPTRTTLLFTTFPFDEAVFVKLLEEYPNAKEHKIIVLHDIMVRRHRGYLQDIENTTDIKVIPVRLIMKKSIKGHCPVFHSKIWAEIDETHNRIEQLLVLSANLSGFHFAKGHKTLDIGCLWGREQIASGLPDFIAKIITKTKSNLPRLEYKPATLLLIDTHGRKITLETKTESAGELIREHLKTCSTSYLKCSAPFINRNAINKISESITPAIYRLSKKMGEEKLHAKFIAAENCFLWGSPNLTQQALWGFDAGPFNHETLVISPTGPALTSFAKDADEHTAEEDDAICEELDEDTNWAQEKAWAVNAPDKLALESEAKFGVLTWDHISTRCIEISGLKLKINPRLKVYALKSIEAKKLAKIFLKEKKLEATGLVSTNQNKKIWKREIELPLALWKKRESLPNEIIASFGKQNDNEVLDNEQEQTPSGIIVDEDVRTIRDKEIEFAKAGNSELDNYNFWSKWLAESDCVKETPKWCIEFAKKLHGGNK